MAAARRKRDEAWQQLAEGLDPEAERRREKLTAAFKAANSFGGVAKEYIEKMVADGRAETTTVTANWLLAQLNPIAAMPVAEISLTGRGTSAPFPLPAPDEHLAES